jgi:hypothetical protein
MEQLEIFFQLLDIGSNILLKQRSSNVGEQWGIIAFVFIGFFVQAAIFTFVFTQLYDPDSDKSRYYRNMKIANETIQSMSLKHRVNTYLKLKKSHEAKFSDDILDCVSERLKKVQFMHHRSNI